MSSSRNLVAVLLLVAATAGNVRAQCGPTGFGSVGPIDPSNGYPKYYVDLNGLGLGLCLDPFGFCLPLNLPDLNAPVSFPGNFSDETFYWRADANLTLPNGGSALLVLALEGAFLNGPVVVGDQVVFSRIRIRARGLTPNRSYTFTHPYGTNTFVSDSLGSVNDTVDTGFFIPNAVFPASFTGPLVGPVGPFIVWDASLPAPPPFYLANPAVLHKVTGSPCNQNFFRVTGPGLPAGGVRTDFFTVAALKASICGNGVLDFGEQCDDGNALDGDCCSSTCQFEPEGQACDDHSSCTINATGCNATGVCTVTSTIVPPCAPTAVRADTSPKQGSPKTVFGTATTLAVDAPTSEKQTFLRFNVLGLGNRALTSAKVRLVATSGSVSGGRIHAISNCTWSETAMTWNTGRPAIDGPVLSTVGKISAKQVATFDVTAAMNHGDGDYCFAIDTLSTDEVDYNSREAKTVGNRPQLILDFGCACSAPTCGDNVINQTTEVCDGTDSAACPGLCQANCTCTPPTTTTTSVTTSTSASTSTSSSVTSSTSAVPTTTSTSLAPVATTTTTTTAAPASTTTTTTPPVGGGTTNVYQAGVSGPAGSAAVDTYIRLSAATTNNGTASDVIVGLTNSATKVNRALMAFNVSDIPATATITSCKLKVNVLQASSATPGHVRRLCAEHWLDGDGQGELQATWSSWKTGSAWTTAGAGAAGDCATGADYTTIGEIAYTPPTATGAFTFDLAGLCQDAVTLRGGLLRLRISQDAEATQSNLFRFDSAEGTTAALRPQLTVTWQ